MLTLTDLEQAGLGARPPLLDTATSHRRPHVTTHHGWIAGLSPIVDIVRSMVSGKLCVTRLRRPSETWYQTWSANEKNDAWGAYFGY